MKFSLENSAGFTIHGYAEGEITLQVPSSHPLYNLGHDEDEVTDSEGLTRIRQSFLLTANELHTDWPPQTLEQLELAHFEAIIALHPELVLLGTGATHRFPPTEFMVLMNQRGVGLEIMDTQAACRTFNILCAEGREVVAALMMI